MELAGGCVAVAAVSKAASWAGRKGSSEATVIKGSLKCVQDYWS